MAPEYRELAQGEILHPLDELHLDPHIHGLIEEGDPPRDEDRWVRILPSSAGRPNTYPRARRLAGLPAPEGWPLCVQCDALREGRFCSSCGNVLVPEQDGRDLLAPLQVLVLRWTEELVETGRTFADRPTRVTVEGTLHYDDEGKKLAVRKGENLGGPR